ncbi:TnsD family Tn7-like transposition protein [Alteromonas facilis]|uniref:TnsD family Tn7-like transposition protein n=1 Tax=Alteromonas facilis TaxID=2048004 RepID=UPI000C28CCAA|nr:TnsD family Tn7-like transposition protein [Alteromonas facilis]
MLGYFPVPYHDELLYSIVARYAQHTGLAGNQKAIVREVFSSSTAVAVPDLPSHLNSLVNNLQLVWPTSVKELIESFTLAPISLPFLSQKQASKTIHSMSSDSGGDIHTRSGIAASAIKQPEYFRYCPKCLKEQHQEFGECYWKRVHQLSGLAFCSRHSCLLEYSTISFHPKEKHLFIAANESKLNSDIRHIELKDIERELHDRYEQLLNARQFKGLGFNRWTLFYRNLAVELGLVRKSRICHQEIHRLLKKTWAGTVFQDQFQDSESSYWLTNLFRKHRKSFHPLRHLLVTTAIVPELSVTKLFEKVHRLPDRILVFSHSSKKVSAQHEVAEYRSIWVDMLKRYPSAGVKELRSIESGGATYAWLYRNDKNWLMSNRPRRKVTAQSHYVVNYNDWDAKNVEHLESVYEGMATGPNRPRLTRTRLIRELRRSNSVEKHLSELPRTTAWLASHEESVEDHQLYRLRIAYEQIKSNNLEVKRWRLLRKAAIREELVTPKIETEIQELEKREE